MANNKFCTECGQRLEEGVKFCPNCGKIGGFSRMCKTIKNIKDCTCGKCNSDALTVVQNW